MQYVVQQAVTEGFEGGWLLKTGFQDADLFLRDLKQADFEARMLRNAGHSSSETGRFLSHGNQFWRLLTRRTEA